MTTSNRKNPVREPSLIDALIPIVVLITLLSLSVHLYGSDSSAGANQVVLLLGAMVSALVAIKNGYHWVEIQEAIVLGISTAMGAILILLAVGALIGTWMMAGTVPAMIFYGVKILNPDYFYVAACLICSIASLSIGSSWTVAGTLGVGLIGVALALGVSPAITAGAVVSGAYFGDKMSPLSDTTNLAPAVAGTELFIHIRHMVWTTFPSYVLTLIFYLVVGLNASSADAAPVAFGSMSLLQDQYDLSLWTLLPLVVIFVLAMRKFPAFPSIVIGALLGGVMAVILQPSLVLNFADAADLPRPLAMLKGVWSGFATGYVSATGDATIDALLSRGGMSSMLNTIWLIICALSFGAVMEHAGLLARLIQSVLSAAKSTGALIGAVLLTCIGTNVVAGDQYMAIVLPGKIYRAEFRRRGLRARNLSRAIEDAGTLTSPLVPWNTCGAFMASTLGVATFAYLPYAFFNLINPLVSLIYGITGFTIYRIDDQEGKEPGGQAGSSPGAVNET